jgi:hypothetical protein
MSVGIDVAACATSASAASVVTAGGNALACTASDGTAGTVAITHLALVDNAGDVPFDYGQAFGFWSLAFTSVVALYFACRGIGTVVEFIRRS